MKVPGRKKVVRTAMIFIDELSRLLAAAIARKSRAILVLSKLSFCVMRLKS